MSPLPDRGPSGLGLARPALGATATGAVRPCASSSSPSGAPSLASRPAAARDTVGLSTPLDPAPRPARPASRARSRVAPSFFVPRAPAHWEQSYWMATAHRPAGPGGVGTGTALGTALGTAKRLTFHDLRQSSHRYHHGRAHVMRLRSRAPSPSFLSLVTWEQIYIPMSAQWLRPFPRRSLAPLAVGTWEQAEGSALCPDGLARRSNKIEGGYAVLRSVGGGARRKFRAGDRGLGRALGGAGELGGQAGAAGSGALPAGSMEGAAWRAGNGGKPPFLSGPSRHVGRADVGRVAKSEADQRTSAPTQKLCRLTGIDGRRDLVEQLGGPIGQLASPAAALELGGAAAGGVQGGPIAAERGVPPPIAAPSLPCTLPVTFGRIWIENSRPARGLFNDRLGASGNRKSAQFWVRGQGPGGIRGAPRRFETAPRRPSPEGERAGAFSLPAGKQAPETGGRRAMRAGVGDVNG